MKIEFVVVTVSTMALAGCQPAPDSSQGDASDAAPCEPYRVQLDKCPNEDTEPKVRIDTKKMDFTPEIVCVERGRSIEFILDPVPDEEEGTAAIIPDNYENAWLTGTNSPAKNKIKIKVPRWVDTKETYKYRFIKNDGSCTDPRVEVTR